MKFGERCKVVPLYEIMPPVDKTSFAVYWLCPVIVTIVTMAVAAGLAQSPPCSSMPACAEIMAATEFSTRSFHWILCFVVMTLLLRELLELVVSFQEVRDPRSRQFNILGRFHGSILMTCILICLSATQYATVTGNGIQHPMPPIHGIRENWGVVHTLRYLAWLVDVPCLLALQGCIALQRPVRDVMRPIIVTNVYIVVSWWGMVAASPWLRCVLVILSFLGYGWASRDMLMWTRTFMDEAPESTPGRLLRVGMTRATILLFGIYGAVYLFSLFGVISSPVEHAVYGSLDVFAKCCIGSISSLLRASERSDILRGVLTEVSTLKFAYSSVLTGSFDMVVQCSLAAEGKCQIEESDDFNTAHLDSLSGKPTVGCPFEDLLATDEDRERFRTYLKLILSQMNHNDCSQRWAKDAGPGVADKASMAHQFYCDLGTKIGPSVPVTMYVAAAPKRAKTDSTTFLVIAMRLKQDDHFSELALPDPEIETGCSGDVSEVQKEAISSIEVKAGSRPPLKLPLSVASSVSIHMPLGNCSDGGLSEATLTLSQSDTVFSNAAPVSLTKTTTVVRVVEERSVARANASAAVQTEQPPPLDASTQTDPNNADRFAARPPRLPGQLPLPGDRSSSRPRSSSCPARGRTCLATAGATRCFDGAWLLMDRVPGVAAYLTSFQIANGLVVDGLGLGGVLTATSSGAIKLEGGILTIEGDRLVRTGKSGSRLCYIRAGGGDKTGPAAGSTPSTSPRSSGDEAEASSWQRLSSGEDSIPSAEGAVLRAAEGEAADDDAGA